MKASFSFKIMQNKLNSLGYAPIVLRISFNSNRAEFNTKEKVKPEDWVNGNLVDSWTKKPLINKSLFSIYKKAKELYTRMEEKEEKFTPQDIADHLLGKRNSSKKTLLEVFEYHNNRMFNQVPKDFSESTHRRYVTTKMHLNNFIKETYDKDDISLSELNFEFVSDFEYYLKTKRNCCHNSASKYIRNLKKITNLSVKLKWLNDDPFVLYKCTLERVDPKYLSEPQIKSIYEKEFGTERLSVVKDNFIFCCYTGLSFIDLKNMTNDNIIIKEDGKKWLIINRQKTGVESRVRLMKYPLGIIEKYRDHPDVILNNKVLPTYSSQKLNAYLKEIAAICGITEDITWHTARHSFATLALTKKVSTESVGHMLGHTNLKTTQRYTRILDQKLNDEMDSFETKI